MFLAKQFETDESLHWLVQDCAEDIRHLHDPGYFITSVSGRDAVLFFNRIPLAAGEGMARFASIIPNADTYTLGPANDNHTDIFKRDKAWHIFLVSVEQSAFGGCAVDFHRHVVFYI